VPSKEYKDGNFFIVSDYANDHTSLIVIDDDRSGYGFQFEFLMDDTAVAKVRGDHGPGEFARP